jgi:hypothetical protein
MAILERWCEIKEKQEFTPIYLLRWWCEIGDCDEFTPWQFWSAGVK